MMKKVIICLLCAFFTGASLADTTLENRYAKFTFSGKNGALTGILNKETKREVAMPENTALWQAVMLDTEGKEHILIPSFAPKSRLTRKGREQTLILSWNDLSIAKSKVDFTAYITLPDDSGIARWRAEITSSSGKEAAWVKTLSFPVMNNVQSLGDDFLTYGDNLGRMIRTPGKRIRYDKEIPCPGHWSMQFAAFYGSSKVEPVVQPTAYKDFFVNGFHRGTMPDETGIFLACADAAGNAKSFFYDKGGKADTFNMALRHLPALPFWPRNSAKGDKIFKYVIPYETHIGTFSGGRGKITELYRNVVKDYPWMKNPRQSKMVSDNVFWVKSYGAANKAVPEILKMREFLQVPVNTHMVRWQTSAFDENNLDYFPALGQMREGVRDMRSAGIGVAPYLCCGIWDSDTESYARKNIAAAAALKENGNPHIWMITGPNPWMNPASPIWQKEYVDITLKMSSQLFTDSQYMDVMAVGSKVCYNDNLKTINGGNYWVKGNCKILDSLKKNLKEITAEPFLISEGFSENYVNKVDCFLIHDITRSSWGQYGVADAFPFFTMTYNDITGIYGSDCEQSLPIDFFRWQMGTGFVWGIQLCYGGVKVLDFGSVPHDIYARNLAQAWYRAGYPYLGNGVALETAQVKTPELLGNTPFGVVCDEFSVHLKNYAMNYPWKGPAIQAMSYRSKEGNTAVIMTNISGKEQNFTLHVNADTLPENKRTVYRSWPLPAEKMQAISGKTTMQLSLPVNGAMILEMRADNDAPQIRELLPMKVVPMTADAQGNFAARKVAKGTLFGCDGAYTLNADGDVSMVDINGNAVTAKFFDWYKICAGNTGTGGARGEAYRRFYVLRPANIEVSGDYRAIVRSYGKVTTGTLELSGTSTVKTADDWSLFAEKDGEIFTAEAGEISLSAGKYRFLAFAPGQIGSKELADGAWEAFEKGRKLLTGNTNLTQSITTAGENLLALANGITFLLTGETLIVSAPQDVLVPGSKLEFSVSHKENRWEILNNDIGKYISFDNNVFTTEGIKAAHNYSRLLCSAKADHQGKTLPLAALKYVEVIEALHAEIKHADSIKQIPAGGDVCSNAINVTNISPEALEVTICTPADSPWQLKEGTMHLTIAPTSRKNIRLDLKRTTPVTSAGEENIRIMLNYSNSPETAISEEFTVISQNMDLIPAGKGVDPAKFTRKTAMIRYESMIAVQVGNDCKFTMEAEFLMRKGQFNWQLFDSKMKQLNSGVTPITPNVVKTVDFTVPAPGVYFVAMKAPFFKLRFKGVTHYVFNCGGGRIFNTFEKADKFYFMLDDNAKSFDFCGADGGPVEPVELIIRDGSGNLKLYVSGKMDGEVWKNIKSATGAKGVWSMEITPVQDFGFKMRNGASGWVATQSAALMKTK